MLPPLPLSRSPPHWADQARLGRHPSIALRMTLSRIRTQYFVPSTGTQRPLWLSSGSYRVVTRSFPQYGILGMVYSVLPALTARYCTQGLRTPYAKIQPTCAVRVRLSLYTRTLVLHSCVFFSLRVVVLRNKVVVVLLSLISPPSPFFFLLSTPSLYPFFTAAHLHPVALHSLFALP